MPSWWDRFGQEWATTGLVDDPTNAQSDAGWAYIGQAPPTVEQFNSMFQWVDDKDNWLYGQIANVISSANMLPDPDDLTQLLRAIMSKQKIKLTAGYTIWCDAVNGNDSYPLPTQSQPFRTIQHAIDWMLENIEPARSWVTIQLVAGTYEAFTLQTTFNGAILIHGDIANQRSYLIKNTNGMCMQLAYGGWVVVQGISMEAVGNDTDYDTSGSAIVASQGGAVVYKDVSFGPCSNVHMWSATAGNIWSWGNGVNYTIYGGARAHMMATAAGTVTNVAAVVTLQNNPMFSIGFVYAVASGFVQCYYSSYTGTARGRHANLDALGLAHTGGVDPDIFFPGDTPKSITRGAMYL